MYHDDVIKWKHFPHYWPFVRGIYWSPMNSPHKGQWRGTLMFSLICAWINGCVNNREAGNLRCHHAHYEVIVMQLIMCYKDSCTSVQIYNMWYSLIFIRTSYILPTHRFTMKSGLTSKFRVLWYDWKELFKQAQTSTRRSGNGMDK